MGYYLERESLVYICDRDNALKMSKNDHLILRSKMNDLSQIRKLFESR